MMQQLCLPKGLINSLQIPRLIATANNSQMNNRHAAQLMINGKITHTPVCNTDRTVFCGHAHCLGHAEVNAVASHPVIRKYLSITPGGRWCFLPRPRKVKKEG